MRDLLEFIITPLLTNPEELRITETQDQYGTLFSIRTATEDLGPVIGKEGKIIRAIRAAVRVRAIQDSDRVSIQLEPEPA